MVHWERTRLFMNIKKAVVKTAFHFSSIFKNTQSENEKSDNPCPTRRRRYTEMSHKINANINVITFVIVYPARAPKRKFVTDASIRPPSKPAMGIRFIDL